MLHLPGSPPVTEWRFYEWKITDSLIHKPGMFDSLIHELMFDHTWLENWKITEWSIFQPAMFDETGGNQKKITKKSLTKLRG